MGNLGIFLDRDGTLIKEKQFIRDPRQVELEETVLEGLHHLQKMSHPTSQFFVITNQSGIARGLLSVYDFLAVQSRVLEILRHHNIVITDFWFCPHYSMPTKPASRFNRVCSCRKPYPYLITAAIHTYKLKKEACWMIGDKASDAYTGINAGIQSALVQTGYQESVEGIPTFKNFIDIARHIVYSGKTQYTHDTEQ